MDDTKLENWFDCYCVCHSESSSKAMCKHCLGINRVGLFHGFGVTMPESLSEREEFLLAIIRSERQRWNEIREYALQSNDHSLSEKMDEASKKYAERSKGMKDSLT